MSDTVFEAGKTYRAVNNALMKVIEVRADGGFRACTIKHGNGNPNIVSVVYDSRGVTIQPGWSDYNLFYGAVEEESEAVKAYRATHAMAERIDNLEKHCEALQGRLDQADNEIGFLARHLGFSVADGQIVRLNGDPIRQSEASIKRVIKGGWVNVYKKDGAVGAIGPIYQNKGLCDHFRMADVIACIQIPDITEGEGL